MTKYATVLAIFFIACSGCQRIDSNQENIANVRQEKAGNSVMPDEGPNLVPGNRSAAPSDSNNNTMSADFFITDKLLKNRPTFESLDDAPSTTSFCLGDKVAVANASKKVVVLTDTPAGSDNTSNLDLVRPGQVYRYEPVEIGTFNIGDIDDTLPLFQFQVTAC